MVIAVTNRKLCSGDFIERVQLILRAEPFLVILREKDLSDKEYKEMAEKIIGESDSRRKILSLNRPEIAEKLNIPNVHITISDIEKGRPDIKRVGVSVHSPEEAAQAEKLGADYLIAGHIYTTDCKKGLPPRGIEFLKNVCKKVNIPVFAIGGINESNFQEPIKKGAKGVCLMSGAMVCDDPFSQINIYK